MVSCLPVYHNNFGHQHRDFFIIPLPLYTEGCRCFFMFIHPKLHFTCQTDCRSHGWTCSDGVKPVIFLYVLMFKFIFRIASTRTYLSYNYIYRIIISIIHKTITWRICYSKTWYVSPFQKEFYWYIGLKNPYSPELSSFSLMV